MSIYHSWLNTATEIINTYRGDMPLAPWLKTFFAKNKKYGSRDRRQISNLCYSYYRLGKWAPEAFPVAEKLLLALFLCNTISHPMLEKLKPEWNDKIGLGFAEKFQLLNKAGINIAPCNIFPWYQELSASLDADMFASSFLTQPELFLRIRPGFQKSVKSKLTSNQIDFEELSESSVAISNATDIKEILLVNREVVIQDYSSQQVGALLKEINTSPIEVWDCCAASGGKSILAVDILGKQIRLTVSDIRSSILSNLSKRFAEAGIQRYQSAILDLSKPIQDTGKRFDLIICDAPCSGSGTWSRTPEQLYFFDVNEVDRFQQLQKNIVTNALPLLKKGGHFLYITCSVFKKENELVVEYLKEKHELSVLKEAVLAGYEYRADIMFAALFSKP